MPDTFSRHDDNGESEASRDPENITGLIQLRDLLSNCLSTANSSAASTNSSASPTSPSASSTVDSTCRTSAHGRILVLSGAGISTDSGIPAYRDDNGNWIHSKPVQASDFYNDQHIRKRYWLRSLLGWPRMRSAEPNNSHHALARMESNQLIQCTITQNVDNLHQRAHSKHVVDLHGNLQSVVCLQCQARLSRSTVQEMLQQSNPAVEAAGATIGPDGDAAAANLDELLMSFNVVDCPTCGGVLKPDVVFFGENVPTQRVDYCMKQLQQSSVLLCVGTSLTVFSGFRFCREAKKRNIPIAIINNGKTRADDLATCAVNTSCAPALSWLCAELIK